MPINTPNSPTCTILKTRASALVFLFNQNLAAHAVKGSYGHPTTPTTILKLRPRSAYTYKRKDSPGSRTTPNSPTSRYIDMSTHDITIDDGCPLITYSGDWNDSTNEDIIDQYWLNTYHSTSEPGAICIILSPTESTTAAQSVPVMFVLEIQLIDIDGVSIGQFDGSSRSIESLALLAKAEGLTWGEHIFVGHNHQYRHKRGVSGFGPGKMDNWQTGEQKLPRTAITNTTEIDDAGDSAVVSYTPTGSWSTVDPAGQAGSYHRGTVHTTSTQGSAVSVQAQRDSMQGNAIYVYGSTDSSSGAYDAKIDGQPATSLQGSTATLRQPALLVGVRSLLMRKTSHLPGAYSTVASKPENAASTAGPVRSATHSRTAVIAGSVVGGVVGCILLVLFTLCCLRLKRAAKMDESQSDVKIIVGDGGKTKKRPLSTFSWNPQRSWLGSANRPISTVSGVSGTSGPGMAGVGAHSSSGWAFRRRSAQQFGNIEKPYPSPTLMPPSRAAKDTFIGHRPFSGDSIRAITV
ncbi:hypothetical protein AG1IA_02529 [Rhizoctonia solani AG-1 IA]|uniref:Uncharacterized protein n=1 Tax=Thanatephorus cucumeris (strain AG1-IA) TaxID=983506 RepID=L8X2X1_THACA|nr:hypothetical protein AG1IA_02529 [Rhizoctonia solani AG-1 IA]